MLLLNITAFTLTNERALCITSFHVVCLKLNIVACLGQDTLGKEIFNLN